MHTYHLQVRGRKSGQRFTMNAGEYYKGQENTCFSTAQGTWARVIIEKDHDERTDDERHILLRMYEAPDTFGTATESFDINNIERIFFTPEADLSPEDGVQLAGF